MNPKQILEKIGKIRRMERGSITERHKENRNGETVTYYNHNIYENGVTRAIYVAASEAPALRKLIEAHRRFRQLVKEYADLIIKETRLERAAENDLRTGEKGIKKVLMRGKNADPTTFKNI